MAGESGRRQLEATVCARGGRFPEAEAAFKKALALSPQFWTAHQGLASRGSTPAT
ncbi:MAG: tetratricopeptide repeat protein [Acidobacteria bacterium]|nr:tetratricopeptide repeat protein [Acidobacteriota bacterium]